MGARLAAVVLSLVAVQARAASAAPTGLDRVRAAGVLRWGGDLQGGEPYVYEDPAHPGRIVGFEVEIADAIARRLGVHAQFVQNDWPTLVPSLERGSFDVILNGFEATASRAARLRLSRPYFAFSERLVVRSSERTIHDRATLRGRRVGTLASTFAWELLGELGADRVPYEGVQEPFVDLAAGRIDAVVIDDVIANRYGRGAGLVSAGDLADGAYVAAVRRDEPDLARAVDDAIGSLVESGELRTILARHGLDGPRQAHLADAPAAVMLSPPRRGLGVNDVVLFLRGAAVTIVVSTLAMALAIVGGLGLALARRPARGRTRRIVGALATAYVEVFRGTPVLLQLYVIYFGLAGVLAIGPIAAAVLGLGLNYAAYEAEVYRAGLASVPQGQIEAGLALGMSEAMVLRRVVLPQALRVSLPGVTNDFIALLKDSSLVSVITVVELTKRMTITAVDVGGWLMPGLLCAALYFALSYPLARVARRAEAHLARGYGAR